MREALVKDIMQRKVKTILVTKSIKDAAKMMKKYNIGGVIVVDKKKRPIGIVTKTDIVFKYVASKSKKRKKLRDIMTKKLITIQPNRTIEEAAEIMAKHHIEKLPVFDRGKLVGIISATDILRVEPGLHAVLFELAKAKGAPLVKEESAIGYCEICGNYSEDLRQVRGLWVCENCRES